MPILVKIAISVADILADPIIGTALLYSTIKLAAWAIFFVAQSELCKLQLNSLWQPVNPS